MRSDPEPEPSRRAVPSHAGAQQRLRNGGGPLTPRHQLLSRLAALPAEIEAAEAALLDATHTLEAAKGELTGRRARLLLDADTVTGRNEQQREAQLYEFTLDERAAVAEAEAQRDRARLQLNRLQNEFAAARSAARLLAGAGADR